MNKLSGTVNQIKDLQDTVGFKNAGPRKLKMQGVISSDLKVNLGKHFVYPDPRADWILEEKL